MIKPTTTTRAVIPITVSNGDEVADGSGSVDVDADAFTVDGWLTFEELGVVDV